MRISDWSSDVCSSDLNDLLLDGACQVALHHLHVIDVVLEGEVVGAHCLDDRQRLRRRREVESGDVDGVDRLDEQPDAGLLGLLGGKAQVLHRSEEHTSELQSLMRISYAVFCLKKKTHKNEKNEYTSKYCQNSTKIKHDV